MLIVFLNSFYGVRIIAGKALVITSALKLADLEAVKKYQPKALILMGGEDGKEPIFAMGVVRGSAGKIGNIGVEFGEETRDDAKLATMTLMVPADVKDMKEYVADKYGAALMNLAKLEESLPAVVAAIAADKQAIMDNINVAQ